MGQSFRVEEYLDAGQEVLVVWRALGHSVTVGGFRWT